MILVASVDLPEPGGPTVIATLGAAFPSPLVPGAGLFLLSRTHAEPPSSSSSSSSSSRFLLWSMNLRFASSLAARSSSWSGGTRLSASSLSASFPLPIAQPLSASLSSFPCDSRKWREHSVHVSSSSLDKPALGVGYFGSLELLETMHARAGIGLGVGVSRQSQLTRLASGKVVERKTVKSRRDESRTFVQVKKSNPRPGLGIKMRAVAEDKPAGGKERGASSKGRAIISVSDKTGIADLARSLVDLGYEIVSTGGSFRAIQQEGVSVSEVESLTSFPEMLDGRVKTLHPAVHGGILARRDLDDHMAQMNQQNFDLIDVVVCNLYPFRATVTRDEPPTFEDAIENIDIGGPTLIRAAAKNHKDVTVIVDPSDYAKAIEALKAEAETAESEASQRFRTRLAWKAFQHVSTYDSNVAEVSSWPSAAPYFPLTPL